MGLTANVESDWEFFAWYPRPRQRLL